MSDAGGAVAAAAAAAEDADVIGDVSLDDIEIIDARADETSPAPPIFGDDDWTEGFRELPVLVFEGLPSPGVDQTEEQLVESVLRLVSIPDTSVRTAVRLPLLSRGKSVVLVEMDSTENRDDVIEHKDELR